MSVVRPAIRSASGSHPNAAAVRPDPWLWLAVAALIALGWVMVGSASITIADKRFGQPFYYLARQTAFLGIGLACGWLVYRTPLVYWRRISGVLFICGVISLGLVLVPGVGRVVNGSMRWIRFGPVNLQPSEFMKLFVVLYTAGYVVRRGEYLRTRFAGFVTPVFIAAGVCLLLLLEPDFGAAGVLMATVMGILFLAGARLWQFIGLGLLGAGSVWWLIVSSPYRMERLTGFLNPWADPYNSGFQLTQALIAFGRGGWFGVGLGGSVEKLFYLPEAHTDFLFAVLAEELGLIGALTVVALFAVLIWRAFAIGVRAQRAGLDFGAYTAWGLGICLGLQALINIGVNMGALPTKGLTLPLMSYGGSSIVVACLMVALLLRVDFESRSPEASAVAEKRPWRG